MTKYAIEETVGARRLNGTDHPVRLVAYGRGKHWVSVEICNGIGAGAQDHRSKREAVGYVTARAAAWRDAAKHA